MDTTKKTSLSPVTKSAGKFADLDALLMTWNLGKRVEHSAARPAQHQAGHAVRQHVLAD